MPSMTFGTSCRRAFHITRFCFSNSYVVHLPLEISLYHSHSLGCPAECMYTKDIRSTRIHGDKYYLVRFFTPFILCGYTQNTFLIVSAGKSPPICPSLPLSPFHPSQKSRPSPIVHVGRNGCGCCRSNRDSYTHYPPPPLHT